MALNKKKVNNLNLNKIIEFKFNGEIYYYAQSGEGRLLGQNNKDESKDDFVKRIFSFYYVSEIKKKT